MLYFNAHLFLFLNFWPTGDGLPTKHHCGVDKYKKDLLQQYPHLKSNENITCKVLKEQQKNGFKSKSTTYTIPVVVHIMHNHGPEKLSDAAVIGGIADLNAAMSGTTQNNGFIHPDFESLKTDTQIEFALAKFDPEGNPTNGIDRRVSPYYTLNGDKIGMRSFYHWPRHKYLNLYIVRKPFSENDFSGFATFPDLVDDPDLAYLDGIVLAYWAFGRHEHIYNEWYYTAAHEVGHWLSLFHTWGYVDELCEDDDEIEDTPTTIGNTYVERSECTNTSFQCNSLDNITNLMDYASPCYAMFTPGQVDRMHTVLNSSMAERNNLHSPENLELTLGIVNEQACEDEILMLDNNFIIEDIKANDTIVTNGVVPAPYSIMLNAESSIRLTSGFKVETGASFKAYNVPCEEVN